MSFGTIPLSLDDKPDGFVLLSMYEKLESENAKLRELIADVHMALCLDKTGVFREPIIKSLERDMRELGVEVES